jgi:hypothetical protein
LQSLKRGVREEMPSNTLMFEEVDDADDLNEDSSVGAGILTGSGQAAGKHHVRDESHAQQQQKTAIEDLLASRSSQHAVGSAADPSRPHEAHQNKQHRSLMTRAAKPTDVEARKAEFQRMTREQVANPVFDFFESVYGIKPKDDVPIPNASSFLTPAPAVPSFPKREEVKTKNEKRDAEEVRVWTTAAPSLAIVPRYATVPDFKDDIPSSTTSTTPRTTTMAPETTEATSQKSDDNNLDELVRQQETVIKALKKRLESEYVELSRNQL